MPYWVDNVPTPKTHGTWQPVDAGPILSTHHTRRYVLVLPYKLENITNPSLRSTAVTQQAQPSACLSRCHNVCRSLYDAVQGRNDGQACATPGMVGVAALPTQPTTQHVKGCLTTHNDTSELGMERLEVNVGSSIVMYRPPHAKQILLAQNATASHTRMESEKHVRAVLGVLCYAPQSFCGVGAAALN